MITHSQSHQLRSPECLCWWHQWLHCFDPPGVLLPRRCRKNELNSEQWTIIFRWLFCLSTIFFRDGTVFIILTYTCVKCWLGGKHTAFWVAVFGDSGTPSSEKRTSWIFDIFDMIRHNYHSYLTEAIWCYMVHVSKAIIKHPYFGGRYHQIEINWG
jgi:hypothetical protein